MTSPLEASPGAGAGKDSGARVDRSSAETIVGETDWWLMDDIVAFILIPGMASGPDGCISIFSEKLRADVFTLVCFFGTKSLVGDCVLLTIRTRDAPK